MKTQVQDLESSTSILESSHQDALNTIEKLTNELKSERLKSVELQGSLRQAGNQKKTEKDVLF